MLITVTWLPQRAAVIIKQVQAWWNVMAHAEKPDFVFRRNGRVHLNRLEASVQSTTGSRGVRISGNNAGYTMSRGSVKGTGCTLHSPVSPSLPLPFVTMCHQISAGLYWWRSWHLIEYILQMNFLKFVIYILFWITAAGEWCWTLTPSKAEAKKEYSSTSTPSLCFHDLF